MFQDLVDINKMVQRRGEEMAAVRGTKRSLDMDGGGAEVIPNRLQKRIQTMFHVQQQVASPQAAAIQTSR